MRHDGRKIVTVLFCDLVGSTAMGEGLDPETTRVIISRYYEVVRGALERHGGTVEKFIGDAVMAVFGIPTLHEDDALRAVRAAADIRTGARDPEPRVGRERPAGPRRSGSGSTPARPRSARGAVIRSW